MLKTIPDWIIAMLSIGYRVVVPTRACALFYRMYLLRSGKCTVLRKQSITTFDELRLPPGMTYAGKTDRLLYALVLLEDRSLIKPLTEFFELPTTNPSIVLQYLAQTLPYLVECASSSDFVARHPWITNIAERYTSILASQRMIDPLLPDSRMPVNSKENNQQKSPTACLFPNLQRTEECPSLHPEELTKNTLKSTIYSSFEEECAHACSRIAALIAEGIPLYDIVVTVCDLPKLRETITHIAALYDIPVHLVQATSMNEIPGARIIALLDKVIHSNFSVESCTALFLDESIPWKEKNALTTLVQIGLEHDLKENHHGSDRWEYVFSQEKYKQLLTVYNTIRSCITTVHQAPDIDSLLDSFQTLITEHLDLRVYQMEYKYSRAIKNIQYVQAQCTMYAKKIASIQASSAVQTHGPWELLLVIYNQLTYVPDTNADVVFFYSYPISAGIAPRFHFLLNQNYTDSRISGIISGNGPDPILAKLPTPQTIAQKDYITCYQHSGNVIYSSYNTGGHNSLPNVLIDAPETKKTWEELKALQLSHQEKRPRMPITLLNSLKNYAHRMSQETQCSKGNARNHPLSHVKNVLVSDRPETKNTLSVSDLNTYLKSPYAFFWYTLGIRHSPNAFMSLIGVMYHEILYQCIRNDLASQLDQKNIPSVEIIHTYISKEKLGNVTQFSNTLGRFMAEKLYETLTYLCKTFPGFRMGSAEEERTIPLASYTLRSRIDILLESPAKEKCILDLKSKFVVEKKQFSDITTYESIEEFSDFQVPCYLYIFQDERLCHAGYLSIEREKNKHTPVLLDSSNAQEHHTKFLEQFTMFLEKKLDLLTKGNVMCPPQGCLYCPIPGVCRNYLRITSSTPPQSPQVIRS